MDAKLPPNIRFRRNFFFSLMVIGVLFLVYRVLMWPVSTSFHPVFSQEVSLVVLTGSAEYRSQTTQASLVPTSPLQIVSTGATISVASGSEALLYWGMTAKTQLHPNTQVKILHASISDNVDLAMDVTSGRITNEIVSYLGPEGNFEVNIPKKKMTASVRGSAFVVDHEVGFVSSLEHVVSLERQEDGSVLVGEGSTTSYTSTPPPRVQFSGLTYRDTVQQSIYDQYIFAQRHRPWWERAVAWIQERFGLDSERYATLSFQKTPTGELSMRTQDGTGMLSAREALRLAVVFQDELLLARSGEQVLEQTSDPRMRSLYARDITLHLYHQSMDALKKGQVPSLSALKVLITHMDLQRYIVSLPRYFASYAPSIKSTIVNNAQLSPVWKEFIRMLDTGVLRAQDLAKIDSLLPGSFFDLIR